MIFGKNNESKKIGYTECEWCGKEVLLTELVLAQKRRHRKADGSIDTKKPCECFCNDCVKDLHIRSSMLKRNQGNEGA